MKLLGPPRYLAREIWGIGVAGGRNVVLKRCIWGLAVGLVCACATGPEQSDLRIVAQDTEAQETEEPSGTESATRPTPTIEIAQAPLNLAVRQLGKVSNQGIVLMNGMGLDSNVGPFLFSEDRFPQIVEELAASVSCDIHEANGYYFLYPSQPIYESLTAVSLEGLLDTRYAGITAEAAFGTNTPLFNAFALLGHALGLTIVADNAVADTLSGEVALGELPLELTLEAVLKSARMNERMFRIESTEEYIFFRHANNVGRERILLNAEELDEAQLLELVKEVDVMLPQVSGEPGRFEGARGAQLLGRVLEELSEQLGIPVRAEPGLERLPVNPVVMNGVRVKTALELLIRQWLLPEFAYEYRNGEIVIRHVGPETPPGS